MEQSLISVIVPVYKAEPYLRKCVDSIRNQTYKNLEILLVNDGSPDRSGELCEELAREDARIRVFHKENGGQSSARNVALDHMTGSYVGFVDSDDWIEPEMYEHLFCLLKSHDAQIAACGGQLDYSDGRVSYFNDAYPQETEIRFFSMKESLRESLKNQRLTYSLCDKLYDSRIFDGLRMSEGKIFEDMEIIPKCLERSEMTVYDPKPLYHYYMTSESTMRGRFHPKKFASADVAREKAEDYKERYPDLYEEALARYFAECVSLVHLSCGESSCKDTRKTLIRAVRGSYPKGVLSHMSCNEKIKFRCLRFSPWLFEVMMKMYDALKR